MKISIAEAIEKLDSAHGQLFAKVMEHGTMSVEIYRPIKNDPQTPHKQDEIYVIASGNSQFHRDEETVECQTGDVLFVPAGMEHRFVNFSEDFATWVIFYGPHGGEKSSL